jgi:hypothetical protein
VIGHTLTSSFFCQLALHNSSGFVIKLDGVIEKPIQLSAFFVKKARCIPSFDDKSIRLSNSNRGNGFTIPFLFVTFKLLVVENDNKYNALLVKTTIRFSITQCAVILGAAGVSDAGGFGLFKIYIIVHGR